MINRTMVRTRVVQTLFAYYKDPDKTPFEMRKEMNKSFADTYDLYFLLLDFTNELTAYAQRQIEEQKVRSRATHTDWKPNKRFVNNRLAGQLFENRALRARIMGQHLSWEGAMQVVSDVYHKLIESDFYRDYMEADSCTYEDDKRLWRLIYQNLLPDNEVFYDALDELELVLDKTNWTTDADVILSYVIKTIKHLDADSKPDTPLLEMFDSEDELNFGPRLMDKTIAGHDQFELLINTHLKGWEADRIADMDRVIIETALAEITGFDEIPLTISLNEYIELAKEYSGEKNYMFVNGILTKILRDMKSEGSFFKATTVK